MPFIIQISPILECMHKCSQVEAKALRRLLTLNLILVIESVSSN